MSGNSHNKDKPVEGGRGVPENKWCSALFFLTFGQIIFLISLYSRAYAEDLNKFTSDIYCGGKQIRLDTYCPKISAKFFSEVPLPFSCSKQFLIIEDKKIDIYKLVNKRPSPEFIFRLWSCVESREKFAIFLEADNGGNCGVCSPMLWVLINGEILGNDRTDKLFGGMPKLKDLHLIYLPRGD